MARESDFRTDQNTAEHIAEALQLQAQYGFDVARRRLEQQGIDTELALRVLAVRYDRRARPCALCRKAGT